MTIEFVPAVKAALKARVALCGPTGSGKTWSALSWATQLGDRVVLIDTERGSAALYADRFVFDTLRFDPPYDPDRLIEALKAADAAGYDVVIVDSLSHFWEGEGGVLDVVDGAAQRARGNTYAGWKTGTPLQRHMVDTILGLDAHVIITMRSKMDYILETDKNGKQVPRKVGMAPVQRAGVEYEFTLVADLDHEHRAVITKSRCEPLADAVIQPHREKEAALAFRTWLDTADPLADREAVDGLVASLNAIADEGERKARKAAFLERFGRPEALTASHLADAIAWVHGPPLAGSPPVGAEPGATVEIAASADASPSSGADVADPAVAPPPDDLAEIELRDRAETYVGDCPPEWQEKYRAFMRQRGFSFTPEMWSLAACESIIAWFESEEP